MEEIQFEWARVWGGNRQQSERGSTDELPAGRVQGGGRLGLNEDFSTGIG